MAFVAAVMVTLAAASHVASGASTTEHIEQAIWLKPRGEMEVEETRVIRFDRALTRITRDIRTPYPVIAVFVSAAFDDTRLVLDDDVDDRFAGAEVLRPRGVTRLQWQVLPAPGSVHTFSASFLMWNVVRQDDAGDYLEWRLAPIHPDGRIERATVRVAFSNVLEAPPRISGRAQDVSVEQMDRGVIVVARQIPQRDSLRLRLRFAPNSAVGSGTRWQRLRQTRRGRALLVLPGVVVALLAVWGVAVRRRAGVSARL